MNDEIEIDYSELKDCLSYREWQQADRATWSILFQLAKKPSQTYFSPADLQNIPNHHLELIDLLWVFHSQERFG